jgi:hypothetical protein
MAEGEFLKGELLKGERWLKGKELLKGTAKEGLIESLH